MGCGKEGVVPVKKEHRIVRRERVMEARRALIIMKNDKKNVEMDGILHGICKKSFQKRDFESGH